MAFQNVFFSCTFLHFSPRICCDERMCGTFKLVIHPLFDQIFRSWSAQNLFFPPHRNIFPGSFFYIFFSFSTYFYKYGMTRAVHNVPTCVLLQLCTNVKLYLYFQPYWLTILSHLLSPCYIWMKSFFKTSFFRWKTQIETDQ